MGVGSRRAGLEGESVDLYTIVREIAQMPLSMGILGFHSFLNMV